MRRPQQHRRLPIGVVVEAVYEGNFVYGWRQPSQRWGAFFFTYMHKKLLIIDSDTTTAQELQNLLSDEWEIAQAKTGPTALRLVSLVKPDVIVLDVFLDNEEIPMNGLEMLNDLREIEGFSNTSVIVFSEALPHADISHLAEVAGVKTCLSKNDGSFATLVAVIDKEMEHQSHS